MLGLPVEKPNKNLFELDYVGIKASQFSSTRLQKADPVLGVDMASTGEVAASVRILVCAVEGDAVCGVSYSGKSVAFYR